MVPHSVHPVFSLFFRGRAEADGGRPPAPIAVLGSPPYGWGRPQRVAWAVQGKGARRQRRRPGGRTHIYFPSSLPQRGARLTSLTTPLPHPRPYSTHAGDVAGLCWGGTTPTPRQTRPARAAARRLAGGQLARVHVAVGRPSYRPPAWPPAGSSTGARGSTHRARPCAHLVTPPPTASRCFSGGCGGAAALGDRRGTATTRGGAGANDNMARFGRWGVTTGVTRATVAPVFLPTVLEKSCLLGYPIDTQLVATRRQRFSAVTPVLSAPAVQLPPTQTKSALHQTSSSLP